MTNMLQSFTLSYPKSNKKGPKVLVLFSNFSWYKKQSTNSYSSSLDEYESEEDDENLLAEEPDEQFLEKQFLEYITFFK